MIKTRSDAGEVAIADRFTSRRPDCCYCYGQSEGAKASAFRAARSSQCSLERRGLATGSRACHNGSPGCVSKARITRRAQLIWTLKGRKSLLPHHFGVPRFSSPASYSANCRIVFLYARNAPELRASSQDRSLFIPGLRRLKSLTVFHHYEATPALLETGKPRKHCLTAGLHNVGRDGACRYQIDGRAERNALHVVNVLAVSAEAARPATSGRRSRPVPSQ